MLEVDNVDLVSRAKDVLIHLWVPETGLVAKVRAGLQQLAHAYLCHNFFSKLGFTSVYAKCPTDRAAPGTLLSVNVLLITGIPDNGALYTTGWLSPEPLTCNIHRSLR